ncbi:MAG: YciK family oxidoreductase [Pseudomonadales bacterium]
MNNYQAPSDLLQQRVILVTGAGDGIGAEAARQYAAVGATVVLLGRTIEKLEKVYDEITATGHPEPAIYPMDLAGAQEQDYEELANVIEQQFGRLDGILHNASILGRRGPLEQTRASVWDEVLQVNLTAPFLLTKFLLPLLSQAEDAAIVFTSSSVGRVGRAFWGPYAVSKFGTEGLMQVLADEIEATTDVRVNSINPGATNTAMRRNAYPSEKPDTNPEPKDIMPLYLYLMGPDSQGVHGQSLDAQD